MRLAFLCVILTVAIPLAGAADSPSAARVDVTRIDGSITTGRWIGALEDAINIEEDQTSTIPVDDIRAVRFHRLGSTLRSTTADAEIYPAAGGVLFGSLTGGDEQGIVADTSIGTGVAIPYARLAGIWFGSANLPADARAVFDSTRADRAAGKDVLLAVRGGEVTAIRGSIVSLDAGGGRFMFNRTERTFSTTSVFAVVFASGAGTNESWPVTIELADGSRIPSRLTAGDSATVNLMTSFGTEVAIPIADVVGMAVVSPRVVYLSDLTPEKETSTGLLLDPLPARFDRSVSNAPLSIEDQTFDKGIGVHADSQLTYRLDGAYEQFITSVGIDDAVRPRGDVALRILGDGQALFAAESVTGRDAVRRVVVDVRNVRLLTLSVEFGRGLDLSDHLDFAAARLLLPARKP
jgi:NPCBM/NEW2 domain